MRRILVENARRKQCVKYGGDLKRVDLDDVEATAKTLCEDVIALDEALARLSEEDPLAGELVKLRYFAGLTNEQSAQALGISPRSADRCWAYAKAWLYDELAKGDTNFPQRNQ